MGNLDIAAHEAIAHNGRPALAWEVLRRDPAYRTAYARLFGLLRTGTVADAGFVARWGLHFP